MKTRKAFSAQAPVEVATTAPTPVEADNLVIELPENPTYACALDLTPWLGRGIDAWVWAAAGQLRAFLASKEVATATVASYWQSGLKYFFKFLEASGGPFEPQLLEPRHIERYIGWLKDQDLANSTQKKRYDFTKSVIAALARRRIVPREENLFRPNPFAESARNSKGAIPLSPSERLRLAEALREDIIAVHKDQFVGTAGSFMVVYLLAVAIRCGANPTPLLEVSRNCLREHPFIPNMKLVELFKRRGNATKLVNLRYSKANEGSMAIPLDRVALLRKALQLSDSLISEARPTYKDRVWLYRSESNHSRGEVTVLTRKTVADGIADLIDRHRLQGDDGKPLRLNLSRLRKTLENRLWALSGGDLIATAALMGHDPKVADTHYLACTQQMRENAAFVGEALADTYRSGKSIQKVIPILPGKSPTGRCKDPYTGDKSPKNGEPCDDFFSCFTCKSYAVVGSPEDLHRLFSFYWFLTREMDRARTQDWREEFRNTMNLIDRFTLDKFDGRLVADAKERAKAQPLKFWASYILSSSEVVNG